MKYTQKEFERKVLVEAARIRQSLKEYTGADEWQKVQISDNSWQHLEVGINYKVKGMPGLQEFLGWFDSETRDATVSEEPSSVILLFRDIDDDVEWDAYDYGDTFAWGSSAKSLIIKDANF